MFAGLLCEMQVVSQLAREEVWACGWHCGRALAGGAAAEADRTELAVRRWGSSRALASAYPSPFPQHRVVQGALLL